MSASQNQKSSLWPAWFPYPRAWLRSFVLMLWMFIVLRVALFWGSLSGIVFSEALNDPEPVLWFLGVSILAAIVVFAYTHHFLLGKPTKHRWPKWLPSPKSLWEGVFASVVMILAIVIGVMRVMPFHDFSIYTSQARLETEGTWFGFICFVTATYLYQVEFLLRRRFVKKSNTDI